MDPTGRRAIDNSLSSKLLTSQVKTAFPYIFYRYSVGLGEGLRVFHLSPQQMRKHNMDLPDPQHLHNHPDVAEEEVDQKRILHSSKHQRWTTTASSV